MLGNVDVSMGNVPVAGQQQTGGGGGGGGSGAITMFDEEQRAIAESILNVPGFQQINDDRVWYCNRDITTIVHAGFSTPTEDADLAGFYKLPGGVGTTYNLNFGLADQKVIDTPKTSAWYASVLYVLRGQFKAPATFFCNAIQLGDTLHNNTLEVTSNGAGGPFHLLSFIGGVLKHDINLGAVAQPGSPTCPIGDCFVVSMYNDPRRAITGVRFNNVVAKEQFLIDVPNVQAGFYVYNSDNQAQCSVGAAYFARARPNL